MERWVVEIGDEFTREFYELHEDVQTETLAFCSNSGRDWDALMSILLTSHAMPI